MGTIREFWGRFARWASEGDLNWRVLLFGALISAVCAAATPYVTLKLGMTADLSYGGMFLAAVLLGRSAGSRMAIQLNLIQTMINMVMGIGFMAVILAAFFYIKTVFHREIDFDPTWWQLAVWLLVSANLGVFMGALPRTMILNDQTLPWPTGRAIQSVVETLSDERATELNHQRRSALTVATASAGFLTFLKDGLGVLPTFVGKASVGVAFSFEFTALGFGMLVPLAVGLSGLLGVWVINAFGETVAPLAALAGTAPENWDVCRELMEKGEVTDFLKTNCGQAKDFLAKPAHFRFVVQWMMWPATAMMITASLTSVILPLIRNAIERRRKPSATLIRKASMADETIPRTWIWGGITICVLALLWLQDAWFEMPWEQVLVAVAIQPLLIVAGLRVLGLTGQGPVSLMANATQGLFGLIWPAHIKQNLVAAHVSADPQASSEATVNSFWVARRIGGRFRTLVLSQLIVAPIACLLLPVVFDLLQRTYGIGLEDGQLSAPTALKISSLAVVMEKGADALPRGALVASIIAAALGIGLELLLAMRKRNADGEIDVDEDGRARQMFWWLPIPSAFGFALILPPSLSLATALGSVIAAGWHRFSREREGAYELYCAPIGAGLIAGEAVVGGILLPVVGVLLELLKPYLS